ncbi:MAG: SMC-Scp complex subunit ScpB [Acidobacteriota bacterium]
MNPEPETETPKTAEELVAAVEALLFVAQEPVTVRQIRAAVDGADKDTIARAIELYAQSLESQGRGLMVQEIAGGFRLVTKPDLDPTIRAFTREKRKAKLSPAARETLAIVAYKQPLTAPEATEIRGVDCTSAIKSLLERKLIRILGRKEVVGRPILYGTTKEFLFNFGLKNLEELPTLQDFEEVASGLGEPVEAAPDAAADPGEVQEIMAAQDRRERIEDDVEAAGSAAEEE